MSENQYSSINPNTNENKVVTTNEDQNKMISDNNSQSSTMSSNPNEKKSRKSKKDENVLYLTIEEEDEPVHIKIKRLIPKLIDEYVTTYKKPIRRSKLQDLVFGYDDKLAKFYEEQKEAAVAVFSFALTKLVREKKVIKVKDPDKKRPTYFILPKHVEMFKK
uniref:Uncharacterized protein n=1 Tax=Acidianus hospitalis (strain W1) TaxID=933801 RepID=B6D923_ACIHW|nr:hypothetical protein [Acidianus hospitalis]ACI15705.1 hypothetical protein [Acidianus hospitalis W1]